MPLSHAQATASLSPLLTEVVLNYSPTEFKLIGEEVFPPLDKPNLVSGKLELFGDTFLEATDAIDWKEGQPAPTIDIDKPGLVEFFMQPKGIMFAITDRQFKERAQAGYSRAQYETMQLERVRHNMLLNREMALATKLNTSANYESGYSTSLSTTWTSDSSDPFSDILTAKLALIGQGKPATDIEFDITVLYYLQKHPAILDRLKYTKNQAPTIADLSALFELRLHIADARYKTSAGVWTAVWQDSAIVYHMPVIPSRTGESSPCFGRTIFGQQPMVESWYDQNIRGTWYRVSEDYVLQFCCLDNVTDKDSIGGYLIDNVI